MLVSQMAKYCNYISENQASDYHPLHQVSFYTSTQISCTHLGPNAVNLTPQQQMMLVHNQSFSIQFQNANPTIMPGHPLGAMPAPVLMPPSYEETVSTLSDGRGGTIVVMKNGSIINIPPPVSNQYMIKSVVLL